jgi:hypothetical protein
MRHIIGILLALLTFSASAETANRAALQGIGASNFEIQVDLDSSKACEPGTSKAEIFGLLHGIVRAAWPDQECEIAGTPGALAFTCTSPPGSVASPLAGAIYRETARTADGACTYECTGECGKYAPPTIQSTTPIIFAPPPPPR